LKITILYFTGGFLAALSSLIFSALFLYTSHNANLWLTAAGVFLEEIVKLFFLIKLSVAKKNKPVVFLNIKSTLIKAFFFGGGFAFLEALLVAINPALSLNISFFANLTIHFFTSLFLLGAISRFRSMPVVALFFFWLAFLIHLCYNIFK